MLVSCKKCGTFTDVQEDILIGGYSDVYCGFCSSHLANFDKPRTTISEYPKFDVNDALKRELSRPKPFPSNLSRPDPEPTCKEIVLWKAVAAQTPDFPTVPPIDYHKRGVIILWIGVIILALTVLGAIIH